jgi:DNA gyrase/topoisomerase IV subunit A
MPVIEQTILKFGRINMKRYGTYINENRALPDYRDGMKPVFRRTLWAMNDMPKGHLVKTARVAGDVIGKYHPHGDQPVVDAIESLMHAPAKPFIGQGNWGTATDGAAAMRYTELRLSKYGAMFIDPDYLAVSDYIPNYDGSLKEPVLLPSLLPNLFLNGTYGIGMGTTSWIPSYTVKSVLALMTRLLKKEKLELNDYVEGLEFKFAWGGRLVKTKENKAALKRFYKTGAESIQFHSNLKIDRDRGQIVFDEFGPKVNPINAAESLKGMVGVQRVLNDSDKTGTRFTIYLAKASEKEREKVITKIVNSTTKALNFRVNVTERTKNGNSVDVVLFPSTIPELFVKWLKWRIELEAKCLDYKIKKQKELINHSSMLIHAINNLQIIIASLKTDDPALYLIKHLKINKEQAEYILELRVRQLSKMDKEKVIERKKDQEKFLGKLEIWRKRPSKKVCGDFETLLESMNKKD